jgi:hypothetical protein
MMSRIVLDITICHGQKPIELIGTNMSNGTMKIFRAVNAVIDKWKMFELKKNE